jgi:N-acetylmuramoyl-L-alanine amidase
VNAIVATLVALAIWAPVGWASHPGPTMDQQTSKRIIMRPIPFGPKRRDLTLSYIRSHYDARATDICIDPLMIVVHWTASPSLASALGEFDAATVSPSRQKLRDAGGVNVSSQFLVDKDGRIYQLMPVNWMARHTIGLNPIAVGIENVGGGKLPLTHEQLAADAWLISYLKAEFKTIHYLIGHNEYLRFRGTPLWRERDNNYFDVKLDPGKQFMVALRSKVTDLHLAQNFDGYVPEESKHPPFSCD